MSDLDAIRELLRDSPSLQELRRRVLSASEQLLLKRLALVPEFDADLVRELAPDDAPSLGELANLPFVEPVPGTDGSFRLDNRERASDIALWRSDAGQAALPDELLELSRKLAARFSATRLRNPVEALRHRLVFEPAAALSEFQTLYRNADKAFDLARCQDMVEVLSDRIDLLGAELAEIRNEYRRYLDARGLWIDEFFGSQRFVLPDATQQPIESLLGDGPRVLDLHGRGGYGKTMHLRWLIARRCVPTPHRIACARIDFDTIDPLAATREPHLVLLEAADQLNWQLPDRPFVELLREYRPHRDRLRRRASAADVRSADSALESELAGHTLARDIESRFLAGLAEQPPRTPIVLILDTLEEALLLAEPDSGDAAAVTGLIDMLARLHEQAQVLRVVFSGRYSLRTRAPAATAQFGAIAVHELQRLTPTEAETYLRERRRIGNDQLIAAAVEASDRVPFNLALIADVIAGEPDISPARIRELPADLLYLIMRVIDRLSDQPLRWLLRYGALPRRLDLDFVREVMLPHLQREIAGEGLDDPRHDLPQAAAELDPWRHSDTPIVVERLWRRLRRYAAASSWVSPHPDDRNNALQLQPEVTRPMRRLLGRRRIVELVHRDAVEHFLARAAADPQAPGRWLREATFHRFQLEGPDASDWWTKQLCHAEQAPAIRLQLAEELALGRDYLDERGEPLEWHDSRPIVSAQTLALARLTLAEASIELAVLDDAPAQHPLFFEAAQALTQLERSGCAGTVPPARLALVRAGVALLLLGSDRETIDETQASAMTSALATAELRGNETAWPALLLARRLREAGLPGTRQLLEQTLGHLAPGPPRTRVWQELIAAYEWEGDAQTALDAFDSAAASGELGRGDDRLLRARLLLLHGDFAGAAEASGANADRPRATAAACALDARAAIAGWREERAVRLANLFTPNTPRSREDADRSELACAVAVGYGRMLAISEAQSAFDLAVSFGERASAWTSVAAALVSQAEMMLRELGHLGAAGVALDRADKVAPLGDESRLRAELLRAELTARLQSTEAAGQHLRSLVRHAQESRGIASPPSQLALLAVTGLAIAPDDELEDYAELLLRALERIRPPAARLLALRGLANCERRLPEAAAAQLSPLAADELWDVSLDRLRAHDRGVLLTALADLQRVSHQHQAAVATITRAYSALDRHDGPPTIVRQLLRSAIRSGDHELIATVAREAVSQAVASMNSHRLPLLAAAILIEAAEAGEANQREPLKLAGELLTQAGSVGEAWQARLELLLAAQTDNEQEATSRLRTAIELYETAGDLGRARAVGDELGELRERRVDPDALIVSLCLEHDSLQVKSDASSSFITSEAAPVLGVLLEWNALTTRLPYPSGLPELMLLAEQFVKELSVLLRFPPQHRNIRLRIRDAILHQLPWELATTSRLAPADALRLYRAPWSQTRDPRTVRMVQASLNALPHAPTQIAVDGVAGPATLDALARAEPPTESPAVYDPATVRWLHAQRLRESDKSVVVVQAAREASARTMRGTERWGERVDQHYVEAGYATTCIEALGAELDGLLDKVLSRRPPPVVLHLTGGFVPIGGSIGLDISGSWGSEFESPLPLDSHITTSQLDRALRLTPPDWPAPIVVLEAEATSSAHETANQLLMRNTFAAELYAIGGARAVLATGLADREDQLLFYNALTSGLAASRSLGAIAQRIRQLTSDPDSWLALDATALWCEDPGIALP